MRAEGFRILQGPRGLDWEPIRSQRGAFGMVYSGVLALKAVGSPLNALANYLWLTSKLTSWGGTF